MPADQMTTIKVPKQLRARLSGAAAQEGLTAAGLISALLDEHERAARLAAVHAAYARRNATYAAETAQWDTLIADGLDDE